MRNYQRHMSDSPAYPQRPLIVRLRNWVGDVTLGLPALQRLADAGYDLQLVGKGWARELLAGHGWPVHVLGKTLAARVQQLRELKRSALRQDPGLARRLNAVCFPYSFSSALDFRLAGLRAIGHAHEGRSLLLSRSLLRPQGVHELQVYWHMGQALLGIDQPPPARIGLRLAAHHIEQALALRNAHGIEAGCIVICPFAGGTWSGQDKTWPAFAHFAARELPAFGRTVVICPGPGEEAAAHEHFASARVLSGVGLGVYAALLKDAAVMISNDTGPGHIAAAVGTPVLSVLGPSDPQQWRAWGPNVRLLQGNGGWPGLPQVRDALIETLNTR
jgi:heptosyltransferase II